VLEQVAEEPDKRLSEIEVLSNAERSQLLVEWNATSAPFDAEACVHHLVEAQVARSPGAVAVRQGDNSLTYAELDAQANRLAHYLQANGIGPDVPVGVCLQRSPDLLVALLGILKAGGAYVPLDPLMFPADRIAYMLADTAAPVVVTLSRHLDVLPGPSHIRHVCLDVDCLDDVPDTIPQSDVRADNLVYIMYTSGSTGRPKGVMLEHRGLVNYLEWCRQAYVVDGGGGAPVLSSIGFDLTVPSLYAPLIAGQTVLLAPDNGAIDEIAELLDRHRGFSFIKLTPAHLDLLGRHLGPRVAGLAHVLVVGGQALFEHTARHWRNAAPDTVILNEYGPTETSVANVVYRIPPGPLASDNIPIGRPTPNTEMYVLDDRHQLVSVGVVGELYIGGRCLARGYLNRPDLTAECFVPHPFRAGARLYRTGDLGRWLLSGDLEFLGRADTQFKVRGFRIEPGEIESALVEHPSIDEAVVVAHGEGEAATLAAYLVPAPNCDAPTPRDLREHLGRTLPSYMIPALYVPLQALPLTPHGKVDVNALPPPDSTRPTLETTFAPPTTPTEITLAEIWQDVLGLERVGIHDDFFDLGGHSLIATQFVSRARMAFSAQIPLRALFEQPTIASLAQVIEAGTLRGATTTSQQIRRLSRELVQRPSP
jgi:amino acid adenylation domain-containing protein